MLLSSDQVSLDQDNFWHHLVFNCSCSPDHNAQKEGCKHVCRFQPPSVMCCLCKYRKEPCLTQFLHLQMGLEGMGLWLGEHTYLHYKYEAWNWIPGPMQCQAWKGLSVIPMFLRWHGRQREASRSLLASQCGKQQRGRPCLGKRRWELTWEVTLWPPHTHDMDVQVWMHVFIIH